MERIRKPCKKRLELGCLAIVDVESGKAMPLRSVQTPARKLLNEKNWAVIDHYIDVIKKLTALKKEWLNI